MSPRTNDFTASVGEDIRQIVRDEMRTVHSQLEAIAKAVRQLSTADVNPDKLMTVEQVGRPEEQAPVSADKLPSVNRAGPRFPGPLPSAPLPGHGAAADLRGPQVVHALDHI